MTAIDKKTGAQTGDSLEAGDSIADKVLSKLSDKEAHFLDVYFANRCNEASTLKQLRDKAQGKRFAWDMTELRRVMFRAHVQDAIKAKLSHYVMHLRGWAIFEFQNLYANATSDKVKLEILQTFKGTIDEIEQAKPAKEAAPVCVINKITVCTEGEGRQEQTIEAIEINELDD